MKKAFLLGLASLSVTAASLCYGQTAPTSQIKTIDRSISATRSVQDPETRTASVKGQSGLNPGLSAGAGTASDPIEDAQKSYDNALSLYGAGKLDEAIAALKEAGKLRPDDAQFQYSLGMAYAQAKSYKDAAESFKRASRLKPLWPEAQFRFGVISYVLGKRNQSIDSYKTLLELKSPLAKTLWRIIKDASDPLDPNESVKIESEVARAKAEEPTQPAATNNGTAASPSAGPEVRTEKATSTPVANESALTSLYRVGVGDVLDIRLFNSTLNRSTLYTVIDGGVIDLPIAGGAIQVAGLTTEEVQSRISNELKRRAVGESAQVSVGIRQFASHTVIITGLIGNPGTKTLRREAVPLYVLLAEAQPRVDAARVVIMRAGVTAQAIDLNDSSALNTLIRPGDVINITARPQEFYYIAGRVNFPGQKTFQPGITLLQAILAAGGTARQNNNSIEVSREGSDGLLTTTKFNLKEIKSGKVQDPRLRPGDRIQVVN
jgi:protein involved in polysaccharide export with SLBB domain